MQEKRVFNKGDRVLYVAQNEYAVVPIDDFDAVGMCASLIQSSCVYTTNNIMRCKDPPTPPPVSLWCCTAAAHSVLLYSTMTALMVMSVWQHCAPRPPAGNTV